MKFLWLLTCLLCASITHAQIYLWEMRNGMDRSCCLSMSGYDICNPYVPCSRHLATDLSGIYGYLDRMLIVEKNGVGTAAWSLQSMLQNAKKFIADTLSMPVINLYYRFSEQRDVQFMHEMMDHIKAQDKSSKTSASSSAASDKQKAEDAVLAYLIKIGVARPLR